MLDASIGGNLERELPFGLCRLRLSTRGYQRPPGLRWLEKQLTRPPDRRASNGNTSLAQFFRPSLFALEG